MLQCDAACCSVLQCPRWAEGSAELLRVGMPLLQLLQWNAVFCSMVQCDALRCSVLQCVAVHTMGRGIYCASRVGMPLSPCIAVRCSVLQCVEVRGSVLQSAPWAEESAALQESECRWRCCGIAQTAFLPAEIHV